MTPLSAGPRRSPSRSGLGLRLLTAQLITILIGAACLIAVAVLVGPPVLATHMSQAMGHMDSVVSTHVQQALVRTALITFAIAGTVSLFVAGIVSLLVTRRITAPISAVADAAAEVAVGNYGARVPSARLGREIDALTDAFNVMADQLEHTEQTRQRLLADLAHEIHTPLATIGAYHEALADGVRSPDEQTWAVLSSQTDRIARLVADISVVSQAAEHMLNLTIAPASVEDTVISAVSAMQPQYQAKGVELTTDVEPGLLAVPMDRDRIGQILANLLTNALRHTPAGGHVQIAAMQTSHATVITVRDDGDGITISDLTHIFDRFYRVDGARDREHGGSGIGLTIARALAQAHRGTLTAASAGPGHGAVLTLTLPAAERTPR